MARSVTLLSVLVSALYAGLVCAQQTTPSADENQTYCAYVTEAAKAQSDLLRTPSAVAAFTQPETGLPTQIVGGATLSLSNLTKSGLTLEAARKNCDLYRASLAATQSVQYAIPNIEKQALLHRLSLIESVSKSLEESIAQSRKMVDAQNMTRPMLFELETTRIKLEADRADTQSRIAALYVPTLDTSPLKAQIAAKQSADISEQRAQSRIARQNNWDVALTVGAHQQIYPVAEGTKPYGEVTVTYNLASRSIDRHLDRSVDAYGEWKKSQASEVEQGAEILHRQAGDLLAAQQARLDSLHRQARQIADNITLVQDPQTSAALDFRNTLTTTQLLLDIEIGDAEFRQERLQLFLASNF